MLKRHLKRILALAFTLSFYRVATSIFKPNANVIIKKIKNFEEVCQEVFTEFFNESAKLVYIGRFDGIKHSFVCSEKTMFFNHLADSKKNFFYKYRSKYSRFNVLNYLLLRFFNVSGYVDIYKNYYNSAGVLIFSSEVGLRVEVPSEDSGVYTIYSHNPVAKLIDCAIERKVAFELYGSIVFSYERFFMYMNSNQLMAEKVDLVYTWVDGFDKNWELKKNSHSNAVIANELHASSLAENRFKHLDELLYSIRSVYMYTNFVRKIYIVTDQQIPEWLIENSEVVIVDHTEIFPDSSVLPSFNSHAIESCLHNIKNISDCFLYLNDDILFSRAVALEHFFTSDMFPKINYSNTAYIPAGEASCLDLPVDSAAKNARFFFKNNYDVWITRKFKHTPCPVNKEMLKELEKEMRLSLDITRGNRFRSHDDISLVSCAYYHWARLNNKYEKGEISYSYFNVNSMRDAIRLKVYLLSAPKYRWSTYCLNDVDGKQNNESRLKIKQILNKHYLYPSVVERSVFYDL